MRSTILALFLAAAASQAVAEPRELITADNAVLCLSPTSLDQANRPARSQESLRGLRCMRSPSGVPLIVLNDDEQAGPWKVSFRPEGISGGVTLWGLPSSFALPDGTKLLQTKRAANLR